MPPWFSLFGRIPTKVMSGIGRPALSVYKEKLAGCGLDKLFRAEELATTQASVKVYANKHYINQGGTTPSFERVLTGPALVSVEGDHEGIFQNGCLFPSTPGFFSTLKSGAPEGLSPFERLAAGKKVIVSNSLAVAYGGYPGYNVKVPYIKPINVGILSLAGAQFENSYLHYSLFALDPYHTAFEHPLFSHLCKDLPTTYQNALAELGDYDVSPELARIHLGFSYLARHPTGDFGVTLTGRDAVIFYSKAYERHLYEDVALLLSTVNDSARLSGKPAFLKATALGMGFFAKVDCRYDISHHLYPLFLRVFRELLKTGEYQNIAAVEFPIFSREFGEFYNDMMSEEYYGGVSVTQSERDVLEFTEREIDEYYVCAINPSDTNALPGNEFSPTSVEANMGLITSLRYDQVYLVNKNVLDPSNHRYVEINLTDYSTKIEHVELSRSQLKP